VVGRTLQIYRNTDIRHAETRVCEEMPSPVPIRLDLASGIKLKAAFTLHLVASHAIVGTWLGKTVICQWIEGTAFCACSAVTKLISAVRRTRRAGIVQDLTLMELRQADSRGKGNASA
jgi:hypothetical protein